jgi:2-keto-4-pentenoate hydratase/2-oxohepta-3-ene-1,7-dioic acid hydratase in catechol pathway
MLSLRSIILVAMAVGMWMPAQGWAAAGRDALVLSQVAVGDHYHTLLVLQQQDDAAEVIDLSRHFNDPLSRPLALVERHGFDALAALADSLTPEQVSVSRLTITPLLGTAHVAAGTNYADHQEETSSDEVFLFPKYGAATAGQPTVATGPGVLLDYEIEICAIFDRAVASMADFESAVKGFYLCSDFTDRGTLLRLMDVADLGSGVGFSDAKSGEGRFAVADRLVVPRDWRSFLDGLPLRLSVNGETRQQATGADMILKLDEIVELALAEGGSDHWRYRGEPVTLLDNHEIAAGQSILTGTPGGVLMQIPSTGYLILKFLKWLFTLAWLEVSLQEFLVDEFVADSEADGTFLQPLDVVEMDAGVLGSVAVTVTD